VPRRASLARTTRQQGQQRCEVGELDVAAAPRRLRAGGLVVRAAAERIAASRPPRSSSRAAQWGCTRSRSESSESSGHLCRAVPPRVSTELEARPWRSSRPGPHARLSSVQSARCEGPSSTRKLVAAVKLGYHSASSQALAGHAGSRAQAAPHSSAVSSILASYHGAPRTLSVTTLCGWHCDAPRVGEPSSCRCLLEPSRTLAVGP
jgi:hypothetical protein